MCPLKSTLQTTLEKEVMVFLQFLTLALYLSISALIYLHYMEVTAEKRIHSRLRYCFTFYQCMMFHKGLTSLFGAREQKQFRILEFLYFFK